MPKLKHETGGRQIEVSPDMAHVYESQGWQKVTPPASKTDKPSTADKK